MKNKKVIFGVVALVLVASSFLFLNKSKAEGVQEYELIPIESKDIVSKIYVNGVVKSQNERKINYNGTGVVKEIKVSLGDKVNKGDVLAILDSDQLEYTIETDQIQLSIEKELLKQIQLEGNRSLNEALKSTQLTFDDASKSFNRNEALFTAKAISKLDFEKSKTEYEQAKSTYETAQKNLSNSTFGSRLLAQTKAVENVEKRLSYNQKLLNKTILKSPIDGTVTEIKIKSGEAFEQKDYMIKVQDFDDMLIEANISEAEINRLKEGMLVDVTSNAVKNKVFKAKIHEIAAGTMKVEGKKQAYVGIKIKLEEHAPELRHDFSAQLVVTVAEKKQAKATQFELVQRDLNGNRFVYVDRNGEKVKVDVELGIESDLYIELINDQLQIGDMLYKDIEIEKDLGLAGLVEES